MQKSVLNILAVAIGIVLVIGALSYFDIFDFTNLFSFSYDWLPKYDLNPDYIKQTITSCSQVNIGNEFNNYFGALNMEFLETQCENAGGVWVSAKGELSCTLPGGHYDCDSSQGLKVMENFCEDDLLADWYCVNVADGYSVTSAGCLCGIDPPEIQQCIDTDPAEDPHIYGACTPISGATEYDYCPTDTAVTQMWCAEDGLSCLSASFPCPLGEVCIGGVCVDEEEGYTCGDILEGDQGMCPGTCPDAYPYCVDVWFQENGDEYLACVCINGEGAVHPDWKPDGENHNPWGDEDDGIPDGGNEYDEDGLPDGPCAGYQYHYDEIYDSGDCSSLAYSTCDSLGLDYQWGWWGGPECCFSCVENCNERCPELGWPVSGYNGECSDQYMIESYNWQLDCCCIGSWDNYNQYAFECINYCMMLDYDAGSDIPQSSCHGTAVNYCGGNPISELWGGTLWDQEPDTCCCWTC